MDAAPPRHRMRLQPFAKDFCPELTDKADQHHSDVDAYRKLNSITVNGSSVPILSIEEVNLPPAVVDAMQTVSSLTSVHVQCWPIALRGRDLLAVVPGEGRTLGYLLPALVHILGQLPLKPGDGPIAVVLTATRDSALKIQQVAIELSKFTRVRTACVLGGSPRQPQLDELGQGCEMCIATPGRLLSFLKDGKVNLLRCTFLVLDETDRMLDIGLEPEIRQIVRYVRPERQTLIWAASFGRKVRSVADDIQSNYVEVAFGAPQRPSVAQVVYVCDEVQQRERAFARVCEDIFDQAGEKVIVFARSRQDVDDITRKVRSYGRCAIVVHGGQTAESQDWAIQAFRSGRFSVLVSTEGAARNHDVGDVRFVVNYDYPSDSQEYARRLGLAVSFGDNGVVYTLITPSNCRHAREVIAFLNDTKQGVVPEFRNIGPKVQAGRSKGTKRKR